VSELSSEFGAIDIYLFDQLLRGRIRPGMRIFEVGCGSGRNLVYLLGVGYEVFAVDPDPTAIAQLRELAKRLAPDLPQANFRAETIQGTTFSDLSADVVVSCAVLHFAQDDEEFQSSLEASWRMVAPGGLFFCRLASTIGMEARCERLEGRRFALPDSTERYLVDEGLLLELTERLGGRLIDPLKTTVVQDQRCMTTWVLRKAGSG
jgi:SAM-dependent methyltransferase